MSIHANLIYVGDPDFEANVLKASTPIVVDFWAEWCGPCRAIAPVFEKLSDEYQGKLRFAKMNIDEHPDAAGRFGVQAIPTMIIFNNGKEIKRLVGPAPGSLKGEIDRALAAHGIAAS